MTPARLLFRSAGIIGLAVSAAAVAEDVRPARPAKEKLLWGPLDSGRPQSEHMEGRRIILDEDSYPREAAKIVEGPQVTRKGDGYAIRFRLDQPDDVLVRIVDANGATVRNLACGVLGWNAPAPLQVDSLSQEVFWDGKDADGKLAPAGCAARVSVGLAPGFERFVAYDPQQIQPGVAALEVDAQGRVYVGQATASSGDNLIARYDREGKFLETVYPPNPRDPGIEAGKLLTRPDVVDGRPVPKWRAYNGGWPMFMGKSKWGYTRDADPSLFRLPLRIAGDGKAYIFDPTVAGNWYLFMDSWRQAETIGIFRVLPGSYHSMRLMPVQLDPFWFLDYTGMDAGHWAFGADGFVYAVIGNQRVYTEIWKVSVNPLQAVSAFEYNGEDKLAEKRHFIGGTKAAWTSKGEPPLDLRIFNRIIDLDVDEEGYLYVADGRMGDTRTWQIKEAPLRIFEPNGKPADTISEIELDGRKAPLGDVFGVRVVKDGLYVVARLDPEKEKDLVKTWRSGQVVKFARSAGGKLKAVWSMPVDGTAHLVAADMNANPRLVWVGNGNGPATFTRITDAGDKAGQVRHCGSGIREGVLVDPWVIALDGKGGIYVYDQVRDRVVRTNDDGSQWAESEPPLGRGQISLHADRRRGLLYVSCPRGVPRGCLVRYDKDLKESLFVQKGGGNSGFLLGATDREGNVYVGNRAKEEQPGAWPGQKFIGVVNKFGPDGTLLKEDYCVTYGQPGPLAMDSEGALYAADVPIGNIQMASHDLPASPWYRGGKGVSEVQSELTYVVKFPPGGGVRCSDTELWAHRGVSIVNGGMCACKLTGNSMAIDESDRIFVTDTVKYHVKVLDKAGNLIARVGGWGNAACRGPQSKFPDPEIAFWWLYSLDACGDALYACDRDLCRIVKARMGYREAREAAIP